MNYKRHSIILEYAVYFGFPYCMVEAYYEEYYLKGTMIKELLELEQDLNSLKIR